MRASLRETIFKLFINSVDSGFLKAPKNTSRSKFRSIAFMQLYLAIPAYLLFSIFYLQIGAYSAIFINCVCALLQLFAIFVIRNGHFSAARSITMICGLLVIFVEVEIFKLSSGFQIFYLATLASLSSVFDMQDWKQMLSLAFLNAILYALNISGIFAELFISQQPLHFSTELFSRFSLISSALIIGLAGGHYLYQTYLAQKELERQRAKSIHSAKMASLGVMASAIAHEINNPLAVISGTIETQYEKLINGQTQASESKESILRIHQMVQRIGRIVSGLQIYSREGSRDPFTGVLVRKILKESLIFIDEKMRRSNIDFKLDIADNIAAICREVQIQQVVINLINNAMDAVAAQVKPQIIVRAYDREQDTVVIQVCDNGPGVPIELGDQIFLPFFTTKEVGNGTGLGLSISQSIIKDHCGELIYKRENNWSIFEFDLPKERHPIPQQAFDKSFFDPQTSKMPLRELNINSP